MTVQWSAQYELGIRVIDRQHQRIVEYINEVNAIQAAGGSREDIGRILHLLVDYTVSHFAFEEALLEEAGYDELREHQLTHQTFIRQIEQLQQRYSEGEDVASDIADMLLEWLLKHIAADDQTYSLCVKERILDLPVDRFAIWLQKTTQKFFPNQ